jgi:Putative transposase
MGARRADWVDNTAQLLRTGTEYFQVVFTLPDKLSSLILGNRRLLYRLLFRSAASALQRSLRDECGMQAASTIVLHTWNQRLGHHAHLHALVPGSGPSLDGTRWVPCRYTPATRKNPAKPFLVDNTELGRRFRDSYVRGVRRLMKAGVLEIDDLTKVNTILAEVQACDWVVYIQPPPKDTSDPADVLKYLARYMTGGPISDRRLIEVKKGRVYFWARSSDKSGRKVSVSLSTLEFIRRWTLHILPKGFTKVRCYGGWSNT